MDAFGNPRRAEKDLAALASRLGDAAAQEIRTLCLGAPDPDALLAALDKIGPALARSRHRGELAPLARLFAASDLFPRILASRPGLLRCLSKATGLEKEKPAQAYLDEANRAMARVPAGAAESAYRRLRRYKYRELFRIALRDAALGARMPDLGRELSGLAQGLISAALSWAERGLAQRYGRPEPAGFCVLALGKLGGEDLNFSSDVDLVYVYRAEGQTSGGTAGSTPSAKWYAKLGEELTKALASQTADGFCYRVDLNLRPHGRGGAIALSLPQMASYYETLGRTWERAALIKARPIAGDAGLGTEVLEALSPFVWRRSLDLGAVDALRDLKAQIDLRGKATLDDVKLGPGGIREVEFFVNALQLLYGGKDATLRERNTLRALRKLRHAGHASATDADGLEDAYLFLRRLENRLQMVEERQTQLLPSNAERLRIARSLGFPDPASFGAELDRHRTFVQRAFGTILGQTARDELPDEPLLALALDEDAAPEVRVDALRKRGFADPEAALAILERLSRIPGTPFASQAGGGIDGLRLVAEAVRTPDPDLALLHFGEFAASLRAPASYLDLLGSVPRARRRLFTLFGQSEYLSRYFLGHPELLDTLVQGTADELSKDPARIRQELSQRAHRSEDPEERLSAMRRYKNEEVLRIGLHDVHGELAVPEVASQLTSIADAVLDECLFLAQGELRERYGEPRAQGHREELAVIALGKLGGRELGYHSDLDLIFVYGGGGQEETSGGSRGKVTHHEYFAKLVQRLLAFIQMQFREGLLYRIDARLRPSGHQGTLVVSQEAFREHHERRAQLWERQALIKARGAAGDAALFERLLHQVLHPLVYERPLPEGAAAEIARLRTRMEREIARESEGELNLKTGHGGLVDVEFATQYLQLVHGGATPAARTPNTLEAIAALAAAGHLAPRDADTLRDGYLFHRRVENRLRLVHGRSLSNLPTSGRPLALLARRLGYAAADPGAAFLADYRAYTARVREVYARVLSS